MTDRIYFDHAATTPVHPDVLQAMLPYFAEQGYNPNSLHTEGRRARAALDGARDRVAALLGVSRKEIVFTGSGTESDNQAIAGTVMLRRRGKHIVSTSIEHHAVLRCLERLRESGFETTIVPVAQDGVVEAGVFQAALQEETTLASVMYANNEIGTIQPIAELAQAAHARGALFHTDAVQAGGWLPLRPRELGVDLLSLSAHKFYGPKGVGVLYVREGVPVLPLVDGGGQEFGRRSGTENVPGIVGLAVALERVVTHAEQRTRRVRALRDRFEAGLRETISDIRINGEGAQRLPNSSSVSFAGMDSETLLMRLDLEGVAASAGSACTSGVLEPSHVIAALGIDPRWHRGVIRFSLGEETTGQEIDRVLALLRRIVPELREEVIT
jgi:cysteine desulfurase